MVESEIEELLPDITNMKEYKSDNNRCAPNKTYSEGSCLDLTDLIKLARIFNKLQPEQTIKIQKQHRMIDNNLFRKLYKRWLLNELKKRFPKCQNESCWVMTLLSFSHLVDNDDEEILNDIAKNTWRPEGPKKINEWLSNFDIIDVMEQYYKTYDDFIFLGAVPVDFFEINYPLSIGTIARLNDIGIDTNYGMPIKLINYKKLVEKNVTKVGIVINLDKHDQTGSHWVGCFADFSENRIYYFDSYGYNPEKQISDFLNYLKKKMDKISDGDAEILINDVRHQYKGSECGVYSMNFILRILGGEYFDDIKKSKVEDDRIQKCRYKYFSGPEHGKKMSYGQECK